MLDDLHSDSLGEGPKRERSRQPERPLADREVPLGQPTTAIADGVHAWLDGDAPESSVRRAEWSRDVEFWKRLDEDLAARRRMRTPAHLQAQIMAALPMQTPQLEAPWYRREIVLTTSTAFVAAATLVVAAAAATVLVLRLPH